MRLNPGLRRIGRGAGSVQIGLGSGGRVLEGLSASDLAFLDRLRTGFDDDALGVVARECGLDKHRAGELVDALGPVIFPGQAAEVEDFHAARTRPDRDHWAGTYGRDMSPLMGQRGRAVVRVAGLGRTGAALAQSLAAAGVGTLVLVDPSPVTSSDLGAGAFRVGDIGMPRGAAARRLVQALNLGGDCYASDSTFPVDGPVDMDVFVGVDHVPEAARARLLASNQPHLPVLLREQDSTVGPLVIPGETACLDCLDRHRTDGDPQWPSVLAQLADGSPSPAGEESALALATAGLACLQVLLYLDAVHRPAAWSAVLHLRSADGISFRRSCEPHPDCWCRFQLETSAPRISSTASP